MSLFKKIKKEKNLPVSFMINRVTMPHPQSEGEQKELKCWIKCIIKRGQNIKNLNPSEAKNIGNGLWQADFPPSEVFKKYCRFALDQKKGVYVKKDASIEVHYSCYSMKDKFQKIYQFDIDMSQYLNDQKSGNDVPEYCNEDVVLDCKQAGLKGLQVLMDFEVGSQNEMDDRALRSSVMTDDDYDRSSMNDGNDSFEELDFDTGRTKNNTNVGSFMAKDNADSDMHSDLMELKEEETRILQKEIEEMREQLLQKQDTIKSLTADSKQQEMKHYELEQKLKQLEEEQENQKKQHQQELTEAQAKYSKDLEGNEAAQENESLRKKQDEIQKKMEALIEEKLQMVKQAKDQQNKTNEQMKQIGDYEKNQKKNIKLIDSQKEEIDKLANQVKEANESKANIKKEMDNKLKDQNKEISMLEKDRFELVKIKTQQGKHDQKVVQLQNENAAFKEEIKGLKAREKDLLAQVKKLELLLKESRANASQAAELSATNPLITESKSEVSTSETNKSLEDSDEKQIAETPKPKEEKQEKKTNCAVPNFSTEDFQFQTDNPFGDNFDTVLEPVCLEEEPEDPENPKTFFKTSGLRQPPQVRKFLQERMTGNAFNKYCLDCKKRKTTHFIVYLGIFVCMDCATNHSKMRYFSQSESYIKDVNREQWDDWQLKSVQIGNNKKLFDIFKEYDILELEFNQKYNQPVVRWYKNKHMAILDGKEEEFDQMYSKPAKNLGERYDMTKEAISKAMDPKLESFENGAANFSQMIDDGAQKLGQKIAQRFRRKTVTTKSNTNDLLGKGNLIKTSSGLEQIKEEKDKDILSEDQENSPAKVPLDSEDKQEAATTPSEQT